MLVENFLNVHELGGFCLEDFTLLDLITNLAFQMMLQACNLYFDFFNYQCFGLISFIFCLDLGLVVGLCLFKFTKLSIDAKKGSLQFFFGGRLLLVDRLGNFS